MALVLTSFVTTSSKAHAAPDLQLKAEAAILVDAETGRILFEKNADKMLLPASMTKMMMEYLLFEAIEEGKITWDTPVTISDRAFKISHNSNLSNVWLRQDANPAYTVKELFEAAAIYSANGATMALAEAIAGSEKNFVKMMNDKAKELGLKKYKFVNSTGLNNRDLKGMHPAGGPEEMNQMSARATVKLAYHLLKDYPQVLDTASIPVKKFREGTPDENRMINWNWMIEGNPRQGYYYKGVDGLKTGSTDLAGYSITATAKRNGTRLISVVMKTASNPARFEESAKLLDYGYNNFMKKEVVKAGYTVEGKSTLPVIKGKEKKVEVQTTEPISTVMLTGEEKKYKPKATWNEKLLNGNGELTAPVKKGDQVGTLTLTYSGEGSNFGYITKEAEQKASVPIVAQADVEKANWFVLTMRGIGGFFSDIWTNVVDMVKGWF
ncbi:D-alanyl-D-alanine carboxypeptidase family protein [Alkalihalobacillus sp. AL-G]|uniref:D-alanyl-D-alanine carboxypeptidase family protein n=1 Tax=Alkalihalobacillus sp. AL-G TaxID=2926399 RepID=UPI00272B4229|nr:D-alanyl-D-alanine carboxypeptidase family protein [Alkalihalobacillus sp. AL-G]WLD95297.1 D-alanyl-D-alanine carboxypeptidase [Alkalihalobacillus sp. AL-G]